MPYENIFTIFLVIDIGKRITVNLGVSRGGREYNELKILSLKAKST